MNKVKINFKGRDLLSNSLWNKGSAFNEKERDEFLLNGLLPSHVSSSDEQIGRCYEQFQTLSNDLFKHLFLSNLQNTNEHLFYMLLDKHLAEMLPLIYTPTVGEACQKFSHLFTHPRGLYLSYPLKDKMQEMINNLSQDEVLAIVVTDGERILGLGDLGVGGIGIPIGKLALYTLFGGIHPSKTLPIVLDVGTNNQELLNDPRYLGWKSPRIKDQEYDEFIDLFVTLIKKRFPQALLQWEDFGKNNASRLLEKYRDKICSFNDDIQGTAAVTLSAILTAIKTRKSTLKDQRFAFLGGGSAGIGICKKILFALQAEGVDYETAKDLFFVVDINGLIHTQSQGLDEGQKIFAQKYQKIQKWQVKDPSNITLKEVVQNAKPTILVGVSAQGGAFTQEIIQEMAKHVDKPAIFPLSNPNSKCEAMPADIVEWTDGKAIIATGSPYPFISYKGGSYKISQCNNVYIFPGVGLGVIASKTPKVSDEMFYAASKTLSSYAPILTNPQGGLFPDFNDLRKIGKAIALEVFKVAIQQKLVAAIDEKAIEKRIEEVIWKPSYLNYQAL